ncbi:hypothetical protein [Salinibacterium sp. ZJ450]|uniref:hypothetical protein n=1 Tax=Salinibacterium sp. ZJ450 TaxID=2708338 RepID=UPI00141E0E74|nr:hypothetical protein [Salinibacterium sp. ZJ450]
MAGSQVSRHPERWRWVLGIVGVAVVVIAVLSFRVGECIDYVPEAGAESFCTSGPAIGVPGAWVLVVVSTLLIGYFVYRLVRPQPPKAD